MKFRNSGEVDIALTHEMPFTEEPPAHTLQFQWGNMHITPAADLAYGLQPAPYIETPRLEQLPQVDIWLLAPGELLDIGAEPPKSKNPEVFTSVAGLYGDSAGLTMVAGFSRGRELLRESIVQGVLQNQGVSRDKIDMILSESDGKPVIQCVNESIQRAYAEQLAIVLKEPAHEFIVRTMREQDGQLYSHAAKRMGALAVLGSGGGMAFNLLIDSGPNTSQIVEYGTSVGYTGIGVVALYKILSRFVSTVPEREKNTQLQAESYAEMVATAIPNRFMALL